MWLWCGVGVALGWLWTPESMPSICLQYGFAVALRWLWGGFGLRSLCLVYAYYMALRWLWVALPRLSRLDVGCSTFDVRCSGSRTVPVRSGAGWAWGLDLLAPSCPRGRCEPGRFAVRSRA